MVTDMPKLPAPCETALVCGPQGSEYRTLAKDYAPAYAQYSTDQMYAYGLKCRAAVLVQVREATKVRAYLIPRLMTFKNAVRTSAPPDLQAEMEGTIGWETSTFNEGESVTDKHGVVHSVIPLVAAPVAQALPVAADSIPVDDLLKLLPNDNRYLDEPDGGSPAVLEQLQRMAQDAMQCRELRSQLEAAEKDALFVTIGLVQAAGGKVTVTAVDAMQIKNLTLHRQVQTMGIEFWTEPTK